MNASSNPSGSGAAGHQRRPQLDGEAGGDQGRLDPGRGGGRIFQPRRPPARLERGLQGGDLGRARVGGVGRDGVVGVVGVGAAVAA
jgi:hypothetical protein